MYKKNNSDHKLLNTALLVAVVLWLLRFWLPKQLDANASKISKTPCGCGCICNDVVLPPNPVLQGDVPILPILDGGGNYNPIDPIIGGGLLHPVDPIIGGGFLNPKPTPTVICGANYFADSNGNCVPMTGDKI